jgi:hypothetical protein
MSLSLRLAAEIGTIPDELVLSECAVNFLLIELWAALLINNISRFWSLLLALQQIIFMSRDDVESKSMLFMREQL